MSNRHVVINSQKLAVAGVISAPVGFLTSTVDYLVDVTNGCGAAGSWFRPPARIYGTLISHACNVHDYQYHHGRTIEDKHEADREFHNNLLRLIDRDCKKKWYKPRWLMRKRARLYYLAVKECGGPAFFSGKN